MGSTPCRRAPQQVSEIRSAKGGALRGERHGGEHWSVAAAPPPTTADHAQRSKVGAPMHPHPPGSHDGRQDDGRHVEYSRASRSGLSSGNGQQPAEEVLREGGPERRPQREQRVEV